MPAAQGRMRPGMGFFSSNRTALVLTAAIFLLLKVGAHAAADAGARGGTTS